MVCGLVDGWVFLLTFLIFDCLLKAPQPITGLLFCHDDHQHTGMKLDWTLISWSHDNNQFDQTSLTHLQQL